MTDAGEVIILPAQFANEIRNEAGLHSMQTVDKDFHGQRHQGGTTIEAHDNRSILTLYLAASMGRMATQDVKLPNGETLRKGQRCLVDTSQMRDADIYEKPDEFDAYRFERMRNDAAKQNQAHLVSTGLAHLGFGHGQHACPGRFFAANEIKVALCHLIMKYDWKLAPGYSPMPFDFCTCQGLLDSQHLNPSKHDTTDADCWTHVMNPACVAEHLLQPRRILLVKRRSVRYFSLREDPRYEPLR
ncbi:ent-kaurene oxidase [Ilyonectria robusta]